MEKRFVQSGPNLTVYDGSKLAVATQTTDEETLKSVKIPGGLIGTDYRGFSVFATVSAANDVNVKSVRFRLGGLAGTLVAHHLNDNVANNRFCFNGTFVVIDDSHLDGQFQNSRASGASYLFNPNIAGAAFDFTQDLEVTITGQTPVAAGDLVLTSMRVVLLG